MTPRIWYQISVNPAANFFHFDTEAAGSSGTSVPTYKTTRFYNTEEHNINPNAFVNIAM
jgi:hypothetical protein